MKIKNKLLILLPTLLLSLVACDSGDSSSSSADSSSSTVTTEKMTTYVDVEEVVEDTDNFFNIEIVVEGLNKQIRKLDLSINGNVITDDKMTLKTQTEENKTTAKIIIPKTFMGECDVSITKAYYLDHSGAEQSIEINFNDKILVEDYFVAYSAVNDNKKVEFTVTNPSLKEVKQITYSITRGEETLKNIYECSSVPSYKYSWTVKLPEYNGGVEGDYVVTIDEVNFDDAVIDVNYSSSGTFVDPSIFVESSESVGVINKAFLDEHTCSFTLNVRKEMDISSLTMSLGDITTKTESFESVYDEKNKKQIVTFNVKDIFYFITEDTDYEISVDSIAYTDHEGFATSYNEKIIIPYKEVSENVKLKSNDSFKMIETNGVSAIELIYDNPNKFKFESVVLNGVSYSNLLTNDSEGLTTITLLIPESAQGVPVFTLEKATYSYTKENETIIREVVNEFENPIILTEKFVSSYKVADNFLKQPYNSVSDVVIEFDKPIDAKFVKQVLVNGEPYVDFSQKDDNSVYVVGATFNFDADEFFEINEVLIDYQSENCSFELPYSSYYTNPCNEVEYKGVSSTDIRVYTLNIEFNFVEDSEIELKSVNYTINGVTLENNLPFTQSSNSKINNFNMFQISFGSYSEEELKELTLTIDSIVYTKDGLYKSVDINETYTLIENTNSFKN